MTEPVEFVDAAQEEWVEEVAISDQPTSTTVRSEIVTIALRLGVVMLEVGYDMRAAINAMTGCARALGMADLFVTAMGRTMMASHVSEQGVPIAMTRAAATIDSFDLYRMDRLHQVLNENVARRRRCETRFQSHGSARTRAITMALVDCCARGNDARGVDHSADRRQPDSCCFGQWLSAACQPIRRPAGAH